MVEYQTQTTDGSLRYRHVRPTQIWKVRDFKAKDGNFYPAIALKEKNNPTEYISFTTQEDRDIIMKELIAKWREGEKFRIYLYQRRKSPLGDLELAELQKLKYTSVYLEHCFYLACSKAKCPIKELEVIKYIDPLDVPVITTGRKGKALCGNIQEYANLLAGCMYTPVRVLQKKISRESFFKFILEMLC